MRRTCHPPVGPRCGARRGIRALGAGAIGAILALEGCGEPEPRPGVPARGRTSPVSVEGCTACHSSLSSDVLVTSHADLGVGCEGCHALEANHGAGEDPRPARVPAGSLGAAARAAIDLECRRCHTRSATDEQLAKRYLHWQKLRERGFSRANVRQPCVDCHRHGSTGPARSS